MTRGGANSKKWLCDNPECDVIEVIYSWDYSNAEIKRRARPG